jgi:hypothetical protein
VIDAGGARDAEHDLRVDAVLRAAEADEVNGAGRGHREKAAKDATEIARRRVEPRYDDGMLRSFVLGLGLVLVSVGGVGCGSRASLFDETPTGAGGAGSTPSAQNGATATGAVAGTPSGSGTTGAGANGATSGSAASGPATSGAGASTGSGQGGASTGVTTNGSGAMAGVGGGSTTTTGVGGGPVCPPFGDACTNCASQACPATYCNCYDNPECFALFQCTGSCGGGPDCQQMCLQAHPNGISDALLLGDCAGTTCGASCGWGQPATPCEKCILSDCESEMNACLSVPSCFQLWQCLNDCPPLSVVCQQGCYQANGDGTMLLQALLDCATMTCAPSCP